MSAAAACAHPNAGAFGSGKQGATAPVCIHQTLHIAGATAQRLYEIYLDSGEHEAFTGQRATIDPRVGGEFVAFENFPKPGQIGHLGRIARLDPGSTDPNTFVIVQSWRAAPFSITDPDTEVTLTFSDEPDGAGIDLRQTNVPANLEGVLGAAWQNAYWAPLATYAKDHPSSPARPRATDVERVLDAIVEDVIRPGKADRFADYLTDGYRFYQGGQTLNRDQYITFMGGLFSAFSDLDARFEVLELLPDSAVVLELIEGTNTGSFQGAPPTGRRVSFTVMRTLKFVDGKIDQHWAQADFTKIPGQLAGTIAPLSIAEMHARVSNARADVKDCDDGNTSQASFLDFNQELQDDFRDLGPVSSNASARFRLTDRFGLDQGGIESLEASFARALDPQASEPAKYELVFVGEKYLVLYGSRESGPGAPRTEMVYAGWCSGGNGIPYLDHVVWQGDFAPFGPLNRPSSQP
jgi:predicted ester cyclase